MLSKITFIKADIIDYIDDHFGVRYSMTTIARDLRELHIYRLPVKANQYEYKLLTQQSQLDSRVRLNDYIETEIINTMIKRIVYTNKDDTRICTKHKLLY